jgi:hypothetical protein
LTGNATGCNKVYKERKRTMSDRTITLDKECLYADENQATPANCCDGVNQADAKSFMFHVLPEIPLEFAPNGGAKEKKGNIYTRIMEFIALFREILLPRTQDGTDYGPNGEGSSPAVIFKSSGGSIQPMIWSPENQNGKGERLG